MALFWKRWKAIRRGKKDGKVGYPPSGSDHPSHYEARQIKKAEAQIRYLTERYEQADKKLKEQYCQESVTLDNLNDRIKVIAVRHAN